MYMYMHIHMYMYHTETKPLKSCLNNHNSFKHLTLFHKGTVKIIQHEMKFFQFIITHVHVHVCIMLHNLQTSYHYYRAKHEMDRDEFMFFLTGGIGLENKLKNPASQWLSDKSWDEICRMCDLKGYKGTHTLYTCTHCTCT